MEAGVVDVELSRGSENVALTLREPPAGIDAYPYRPSGYARLDFPGMHFGIVLPGSFHLQYLKQIHAAIHEHGAQHTLVLVSHFYRDLVTEFISQLPLPAGAELEFLAREHVLRRRRDHRRSLGTRGRSRGGARLLPHSPDPGPHRPSEFVLVPLAS